MWVYLTRAGLLFHYRRVDAEKLSLLSDEELRLLAEKMGIYVPDGLDRVFLIEEIIEAFEDDTADKSFSHDAPDHVEEKKLTGTGFIPGRLEEITIPDRYNETYIVAVVRDPLWIFSFWDIAESSRQKITAEMEDPKLFLRVSEVSEAEPAFHYDISVNFDDRKWYINVPYAKRSYRIDLCIAKCQKIKVLARSNVVRMPSQYMDIPAKLPQMTKSLLILSGSEELHLIEPKEENSMRILNMDGE
jgi:hypothetical protein